MSRTRTQQMPEESARLLKIYQEQSKLSLLEVIDKYASDEYKAMLDEPEEIEIIDV